MKRIFDVKIMVQLIHYQLFYEFVLRNNKKIVCKIVLQKLWPFMKCILEVNTTSECNIYHGKKRKFILKFIEPNKPHMSYYKTAGKCFENMFLTNLINLLRLPSSPPT